MSDKFDDNVVYEELEMGYWSSPVSSSDEEESADSETSICAEERSLSDQEEDAANAEEIPEEIAAAAGLVRFGQYEPLEPADELGQEAAQDNPPDQNRLLTRDW